MHALQTAVARSSARTRPLRMSDAIQVTRLHIEYLKAFPVQPEPSSDDDWTEEDDAELERIAKMVKARRNLEQGGQAPDEQDSKSDASDDTG